MTAPGNVVIVGAGPAGLLLAGDLAAAGVPVTVLERRATGSSLTRAFAVHARTLEILDAREMAGELLATGQKVRRVRLFGAARVDLSRLPGRFPYLLVTPQYETERVLEGRALAAGAEIVRGAEVVGLRQDETGVEVEIRLADGTADHRRADYLVGCDGVRSRIREALGLPFPGRSAIRSVMLADVRLDDEPREVLTVGSSGDAFAFLAPFGDGWYRAIAWNRDHQVPDTEPVDLAELRATVRRALGTDHGMRDPRWTSRFHSDERQVPRYSAGRVFLAGDAAHVHSPAGGMGMNTGLQDAANLGWKLAAVLHGHTGPGLLDTYHAERHPVGRAVLRTSGGLVRAATLGPRPLRAARTAAAALATRVPPVARRAAETVSGIGVAYPPPRGAHPLTGRRAPDIPLMGEPSRLHEALRGGRFVLVVAANDPAVTYLATKRWADRVHCASADGATRTSALVRPDGHIAWATDETAPDRRATQIRDALTMWCGPPAAHVHH
ncbi:FAD-dependent monooxygenase [Actinomadura kijaniata]|uniref:2-polyprenyl-6-methoxyphenol hydroxylase-like FAD-dependent oxidoreductase n=1 Tax=Actinomadura namibiensis TaxID=182080 RepID=A0A7W3QRK1_ACTNM|nr:FAD-dependent monooxygenase [Actinomadura namibiensis]MBA8956443.1 2-polyprenyl-6-methoxyphenol hydroxylase-like FAD-dependent oxidoreductase [Actinomadura namibiensis]